MKKNLDGPGVGEPLAKAIAQRVRELRKACGMKQDELSRFLNRANNSAVSRLEGATALSISYDVLEKLVSLAEHNEHTAEWLLTGFNISPAAAIPDLEAALSEATRWHYIQALPPEHRGELSDHDFRQYAPPCVHGYRTVPPEDVPTTRDWWKTYVPIIGRVAAGTGGETVDATAYPPAWAAEFVIYEGAPQSAAAVRVSGRSMEPVFMDGDLVIVDPGRPAAQGTVCCVVVDNGGIREAKLKIFHMAAGWVVLESTNQAQEFSPVRLPAGCFIAAYEIIEHLPLILHASP